MCEYGFEAGNDFLTEDKNVCRADGTLMPQTRSDYMFTLSMAKEICMIQRNGIHAIAKQANESANQIQPVLSNFGYYDFRKEMTA